jgi:ParB-like chromosome segregation protein Spo0J
LLVADIKAHGLIEPIVIYQNQILDGRNRYRACIAAGVDCRFVPYTGDDPVGYVASKNIYLRHLKPQKRNEAIVELLRLNPHKSDRQIAKEIGVDHKTIGAVRRKAEDVGSIPHVEIRTDSRGRKQPAKKVAYVEEEPTAITKPESQRGSVSAKDNALKDFSARAMELDRLTRNKSASRFAKTSVSDEVIRHLAKLFNDLITIRNEKVVDRICGSAEVSIEQRRTEHAALDEAGVS